MTDHDTISPTPVLPTNFSNTHSILLPFPPHDVFRIIGTKHGHESVTRLSALCSGFSMTDDGEQVLVEGGVLGGKLGWDNPSSNYSTKKEELIPRVRFTLQERVPVLFSLFKVTVNLKGTYVWDASRGVALYQSESDGGIRVWKQRVFEAVVQKDAKVYTRVTEHIQGWAPVYIRAMVEKETAKSHNAHMNQYHTLFST